MVVANEWLHGDKNAIMHFFAQNMIFSWTHYCHLVWGKIQCIKFSNFIAEILNYTILIITYQIDQKNLSNIDKFGTKNEVPKKFISSCSQLIISESEKSNLAMVVMQQLS